MEGIVSAVLQQSGLSSEVEAKLALFAVVDALNDVLDLGDAETLAALLPAPVAAILRPAWADASPPGSRRAWRESVRDVLDAECVTAICRVLGRECPLDLRARLELKLPTRVLSRLEGSAAIARAARAQRPPLLPTSPTWRPGQLVPA